MADPKVEALLRKINRLVVDDLRGLDASSTGNQLPVPTPEEERLLGLLADSSDIPARLAPGPAAILGREAAAAQRRAERQAARRAKKQPDGPYDELPFEEAADDRRAISRVLTDMVALCADTLQPRTEQPAPAHPDQRDRIGWATSRAYAHSAARRLVPGLFVNGQVDDLGLQQPSVLEGDVAAARALAAVVGARLGQSGDQVLRQLAAAGQGGTAPAVAELLLPRNRRYETLPRPEQEALVRLAAQRLEAGFASRDERGAADRELTEVIENRREDIAGRTLKDGTVTLGGAGAVDAMGTWANDQIEKLHTVFATLPDSHPAKQAAVASGTEADVPSVPVPPDRAESVQDLSLRIQAVVGHLTGTTDSLSQNRLQQALGEPPDPAVSPVDYSVRLSRDAALALRELTVDATGGSLSPGGAAAAREAIADLTAAYTRLAVPAGYNRLNEERADAVAPRFLPLHAGTSDALAEIANDEVIDRIVPAGLAEQLREAEPPRRDSEYAKAALALAKAVDDAREPAFPNETLRRMGGQGRAGVAMAAAHRLVDGSSIALEEQPFAIRVVAETIDTYFDDLPARIEQWRGGEAGAGAEYGEQVAQRCLELVRGYEAEPGWAGHDSREADRTVIAADPHMRFASDPASTGRGVQAAAPATSGAAVTTPQPKETGRDR